MKKTGPPDESLKGWKEISAFLEQPVSVVQRWAREGMPVKREGRWIYADRKQLRSWLGFQPGSKREAQIASNVSDLGSELQRSLSSLKTRKRA
jgi:phage terminase Nu1 subunit (DNA packaging protein)